MLLDKVDNRQLVVVKVSCHNYTAKPTDEDIRNMCWSDGGFDILQFVDYISTGYTFTPLSRQKAECWDKYSNVVFIDIDHSDYTLDEHFDSVPYKPTVAYETYSDTATDHRYRFVYVFNKCYSGRQFNSLLQWIIAENGIGKFDRRALNQYYNGTYNKKVVNTGNVYALPDNLEDEQPKTANDNNPNDAYRQYFSDEVWDMYWQTSFTDFRRDCFDYYGTVAPIEKPYIFKGDERILEQPEGYVKVPIKMVWDKDRKQKTEQKWQDGEMRTKKLYKACIVFLRIEDGLTPDKLLYYLVDYFVKYVDNSDGKFTKKDLIQKVVSSINSDITVQLKPRKNPSFRVNSKYCELHEVTKRQVANKVNGEKHTAKKLERYNEIRKYYDPAKTNKENLLILNDNGIVISSRTLDNFKKHIKANGLTV